MLLVGAAPPTRSMLSTYGPLPGVQGQQSVHAAEPYTSSGRERVVEIQNGLGPAVDATAASRSWTAGSRGRATRRRVDRASSPARTAGPGRSGTPQRLRSRNLDMLTPDRPRRCRAQLAYAVCAELQEAARSAVGSHAPVETPRRSSGVHAAATRRRPAGSAVSRTGHPAQARRCGKRVAGYPVGDGGSGAGVLSTRR